MNNGKRGQISYEYLVIVGMVLMLVLPFFNYTFYSLGGNIVIASGAAKTVQLATGLEDVSYLGPGNVKTYQMEDVQSITISQDGEVTTVLSNGESITIPSTVVLSEEVTLQPRSISIANKQGQLVVVNTPRIEQIDPADLSGNYIRAFGYDFGSEPTLIVEGVESGGERVRHSYRLQRGERDAQRRDVAEIVSIPVLPPGTYTLRVVVHDIIYSPPFMIDNMD
jgi:uncharacterized protein (UPF0333 family)